MADAFLLTPDSAAWIARKRAEGDAVPPPTRQPGQTPGGAVALVRCGAVADAPLGVYAGRIVRRLSPADPWDAATADVALADLGGGALAEGQVYLAHAAGLFPAGTGPAVYWTRNPTAYVYDLSIDPVTNVCVTVQLTKTYATTQLGGQNVLTDVVPSVSVFLEKRNVPLLEGIDLGAVVCSQASNECCDPPPAPAGTFGSCPHVYPGRIYATFSGATGTCGCFTGSMELDWTSVGNQYVGTFTGCTGTVTVALAINSLTTPTTWTFAISGGSYTFSSSTASQSFSFVCEELVSTVSVQVDAGACVGTFSVAFSE
jgi:uncharacterized protein (DUF983 family)